MEYAFIFDGYLSDQTTFVLFAFDGYLFESGAEPPVVAATRFDGIGGVPERFFGGDSYFDEIEREEEEIIAFVNAFMRCL